MPKACLQILTLLLGLILPARGMLFWNKDNSANQTDPGTGVPWGSVAKVVNSGLSALSGSAIYLGNGYLLTANHVTMNSTYAFVTFDGVNTFQIDTGFKAGVRTAGKQVAPNVDLAVFKLTTLPSGITPATLLSTPDELEAGATMVGWGVGRNPATALESTSVPWGTSSTSAKRWGVNEPKALANISYGSYNYEALITYAGGTGASFNPDGLGDSEASATLYDSGSGLFQFLSGQWQLIGLTTSVDQNNTTTFGNDQTALPHGDANYFVRISSYESAITALIPEPSIPAMLGISALIAFGIARHRARRLQPWRRST